MANPFPKEAWLTNVRNAEWRRDAHTQNVDAAPEERSPFEGAQFIAFFNLQRSGFNKFGGMDFTFTIPSQFVEEASTIRFAGDWPLSIDVQVFKPYAEFLAENNGG